MEQTHTPGEQQMLNWKVENNFKFFFKKVVTLRICYGIILSNGLRKLGP